MKLKEMLKNYKSKHRSKLEKYVIQHILDVEMLETDKEIKAFFSDLSQGGCSGGMIGSLIYYVDTHKFFDGYYDEIMELVEDLEQEYGSPLWTAEKGDLKNFFAWLVFEETAFKIAIELNINQ